MRGEVMKILNDVVCLVIYLGYLISCFSFHQIINLKLGMIASEKSNKQC